MKYKQSSKRNFFSRKYFVLLVVCIITGFIIGYSYNLTKDEKMLNEASSYFEQENTYREQLIEQQERNKELTDELNELEVKIRAHERQIATDEQQYEQFVEQAEQLRLILGYSVGAGEGIRITLTDGEYDPASTNPNDYIVHDSHIFKLLNELKIAGAEAISINGQRLTANSYINCNGPVITIDGKQHPAPFVIEAVGNQTILTSSLQLTGGVVDQLLNERVQVMLEKVDTLTMQTISGL